MSLWIPKTHQRQEALQYIDARRKGLITSFITPWDKINDATCDGIEWGTVTVIAARPSNGKSLMKDQLVNEGFLLNKHVLGKIRNLSFSMDMSSLMTGLRELSAGTGKSYTELCSAKGYSMTDEDITACYACTAANNQFPCDVVDDSPSVDEFKAAVIEYMESFPEDVKVIVDVDHMILFKLCEVYKDQTKALYAVCDAVRWLKKRYKQRILFILLNQLLKSADDFERNENGKLANYPTTGDMFGGDATYQLADTVIALKMPWKNGITEYGPDRFIIDDPGIIAGHVMKARNNNARLSFFAADFAHMRMVNMATPGQIQSRSRK
jgi:hypothetical protein